MMAENALQSVAENKLTPKQQLFVGFYLGSANFNATRATKLAGYEGNDVTLASVGYENLRKPQIVTAIDEALKERAMPPEEIIARLSDIARGSLDDIGRIDDHTGAFYPDLRITRERGLLHTIESVEYTDKGQMKVKRYNAVDALEKLARIRQMFADRQEHIDIKVLTVLLDALPEEFRVEVMAELERRIREIEQ